MRLESWAHFWLYTSTVMANSIKHFTPNAPQNIAHLCTSVDYILSVPAPCRCATGKSEDVEHIHERVSQLMRSSETILKVFRE